MRICADCGKDVTKDRRFSRPFGGTIEEYNRPPFEPRDPLCQNCWEKVSGCKPAKLKGEI